ncbi:MAG: hypothetical protein IJJ06_11990 [Mogibacterium sp.]|nr:hypothetical protein [Mogibacterium sp.]MBR0341924.1 hypothetical protein [Oscillospiraceae bacterium]
MNKRGSSLVMLAIIFTGFAMCIAGAIGVSRRLVVSSECEMFGRLWNKAILSEYDVHLLDDYSIMAYFGNDDEVTDKLNSYLKFSTRGRLGARIKGANADLTGYELGDPANFRKALKLGFAGNAASEIINGSGRIYRNLDTGEGFEEEGRVISNPVVTDTLPSHGTGGSVSGEELTEKAKSAGDENGLAGILSGTGAEILLLEKCFDNHVTSSDDKKHLLVNEWEYVIIGNLDDEKNYRAVRRRLFIARNALNLAALYKDPVKVEMIVTIAETITPGPLGIATQAIIAEAWAALESEEDLEDLYHDRRVPVLKTPEQWKTDLDAVLGSDKVKEKLDDESRELLEEKHDEVFSLAGGISTVTQFRYGLNYDEYLMLMAASLSDNVRLLRIMDLIQINMKYRYYADFNMMEYYTGVRFTIEANGDSHEFEDAYK